MRANIKPAPPRKVREVVAEEFDKPLFDFGKIRRMFVDYAPCEECTNPDAYGTICVKCGACGRKFDDKGVLINNASTSNRKKGRA